MKRVQLLAGVTAKKPGGGSIIYAQGFHNVRDSISEEMAKAWVADNKAVWVDEKDEPSVKPVDHKEKKAKKK